MIFLFYIIFFISWNQDGFTFMVYQCESSLMIHLSVKTEIQLDDKKVKNCHGLNSCSSEDERNTFKTYV